MTVDRDNSASSEISRAKKDFYKQYSYLKPDCEKTDWEKFCEGLKKVGQWCKDHWKEIVLVIEIVVAVVCICVPGLQGIGTGILIGALKGALTGGLIGGITSMLTGGSFLEGFAQGALDGAIMGGALGGVGGIAGKFITCGSKLGNAIQTTSKISGAISNSMDGFDMVSLGLGMIDPNNPITELNNKMHQSDVYNKFQMGVSLVSSFSGAASQNMACFVAGTLVLTTAGLLAIEKINPGEGEGPDDPGHGPNRGFGNSAFPDTWSDDNAIKAVEDVANSPKSIWQQSTGPGSGRNAPKTIGGPDPNAPLTTRNGRPVRFTVEGQNHSLDIRVIVEPGGEGIVTGFPINR